MPPGGRGSYRRPMIRFCLRHRRLVVLMWLALCAALVTAAALAPGPSHDDFSLPDSESGRAAALLGPAAAEPKGAIVVSVPSGVQDAHVRRVTAALALPGVHTGPAVLSGDGTVARVPLDYPDEDTARRLKQARDGLRVPGADVELSGGDFADFAPGGLTEGVGLLAAAVILLLALRSVIAAALPLVVGVAGVTCGVALLTVLSNLVDTPAFAVYLTIMLGLGVGVDYALLIVTRHRAALHEHGDVERAVTEAMRTAGRSVLFAGLIVIATGSGILFLGPAIGGGIALAAGCGVLMVMLASLTLLPALLALIGHRIDRFARGRRTAGGPRPALRWSRVVRRRPRLTGALALVALAVLALPAADLRTGWSDAGNRPVTDTTRRAHDLLGRAFGPGWAGPLVLAVADPGRIGAEEAAALAGRTPGVARAFATGERSALVIPRTGPQDERTTDLLHRLRAALPAPVLVTGATAAAADYAAFSAGRLPWTVGGVLLAAFVLLTVVFRSLVLPVKAIVVNLLSVAAAYGVVVAVFQWDVLGLGTGGPVDAWVPMMLFVVTFGLSMDYEVFLLSRVREEYTRTADAGGAVAAGLARTAGVITAAASIMFCVFAAFGAFDDRALRIMGVGLAVAVLLDATVVRLVLVPAVMEVLGERAWWFPVLTPRRLTSLRKNT
ncbi:membrane protein [Nonomuraea spiralis]|nr:membrane protein [Nonomuraea spiralis]